MKESVIEILSHYTETDLSEIKESSELINDLGFSSFDIVNAVVEFEDAFEIEIPDEDIQNLKTVNDVINYILSKQ